MTPLIQRVNIDQVVENSFKDFHVKGFDYLCLQRSPTLTYKLYFFNGDVTRLPEVVNPHDHRYDFDTFVMCGATENIWFENDTLLGKPYNRFEYRTKLNGGDGFTYAGTEYLAETKRQRFTPFNRYKMAAEELHTIRIAENESVIALVQYEDKLPLDVPTSTFTQSDTAPSLDGLYNRFTADQVIKILCNFEERTGLVLNTSN